MNPTIRVLLKGSPIIIAMLSELALYYAKKRVEYSFYKKRQNYFPEYRRQNYESRSNKRTRKQIQQH